MGNEISQPHPVDPSAVLAAAKTAKDVAVAAAATANAAVAAATTPDAAAKAATAKAIADEAVVAATAAFDVAYAAMIEAIELARLELTIKKLNRAAQWAANGGAI